MRTAASSASPLALLGVAFAAAAGIAIGTAVGGPAVAAVGNAGGVTSGTCRICHTDSRYGTAFGHKGLEQSADGCLTCHDGGETHVKARGGKGSIGVPAKSSAGAERDLCLQCHEEDEYATPKHLAPKARDARCTACHVLHGEAKPSRGPSPAAKPAIEPGAPPPKPGPAAPPRKGKSWGRGAVEAGWRFVGGEEGRYEQDVDLDDGPRVFGLRAEGGTDDADPRATRGELRLDGAGDPHTSLFARAKRADEWDVTLRGRRDELPFLGQNGLHGGETLAGSLSADADLRLSKTVRAGVGWSARNREGDLNGTVLENGVVLPVLTETDRLSQEAWGSVDFRGEGWRAKVRQAWLHEEGEDGRSRDESNAAGKDVLTFDDDSEMSGPVTSVMAGMDGWEGRFTVEVRASRADLQRDVDVTESRQSDLAGPYRRTSTTEGERRRILDVQALDASLDVGKNWALEAGAERRSLREDGEFETTTNVLDSSGTTSGTTRGSDRVSQRTTQEYLAVRHTLEGGFGFRAGTEWIADSIDYTTEADSGDVRTRGIYGGFEGPIARGPVRARADVRTARGSDVYTPLTPEDRDDVRLGLSYRDADQWRGGVDWRHSDLRASASDLASRGNELRVWGGGGDEDGVTADVAWTVRQLTLEVDTLSYVGTSLEPGEAVTKVRSHVLDFSLGFPLADRFRLRAWGAWVIDHGNLPLRALDVSVALHWEMSDTLASRLEYRRREYDEMSVDVLDYEADILEVAVELRF